MNGLSWMLYIADVLPSLAVGIAVISVIFMLAVGSIGTLMYFLTIEYKGQYERHNGEARTNDSVAWVMKRFLPIALVAFLLASLVPSKETIYLIAGSEAGQVAVESEYGQELISDIQKVIKHQLSELQQSEESE